MLVLRDELSGWLRALDKPGREGDREFYLEAWNGTGSYTVDRIGRGTIHIPTLTLGLRRHSAGQAAGSGCLCHSWGVRGRWVAATVPTHRLTGPPPALGKAHPLAGQRRA